MACHNTITRWERPNPAAATTTGSAAPGSAAVRIGDQARQDVQDLLGQALAMGYLSMAEFQTRLDLVAVAVTSADLAQVLADLPAAELRRNDPTRRAARAAAARRGVRVHTAAYVAGALLLMLIWLAVAIPTGLWYPWPIWPLLGGAVGVLSHAIPVHAATRR